ncbi:MAG: M15 family metallopeptidase [Mogibacterium sp.]|nr:M15 family metallopeptidase [Mogibacterium sp.]
MKKTIKTLLVILVLICLTAAAAFAVLQKHSSNAKKAEEAEAERIEQEAAEEERQAQAIAAKIDEEKSQWYLLLVNEWNAMPDDFSIETAVAEDGYEVDARVKDALEEMLSDCRAAGYDPRIISSFRTREFQQYLYDRTANKADTAIPGRSEHECGLAADIVDADSLGWGDPLIDEQEDMPAQKWLMEHCQDYGFILRYPKGMQEKTGIIYEPWHYRYVGKEHATIIMENGICLEEYLEDMASYYHPEV